ncbi:MAG: putative glycoside hydrolase [Treponemataceae bacterium]
MNKKNLCIFSLLILFFALHSAGSIDEKKRAIAGTNNFLLVGTEDGLYKIENEQKIPLWTEGSVKKIIQTNVWYILTSKGIFKSNDLITFVDCNQGLPINVIKEYDNGKKSFKENVQSLKDLETHPSDPNILVTATKDAVFLSKDAGNSWKNIGSNSRTAGIKAVAIASLPNQTTGELELVAFISHAIYSLGYCKPDAKKIEWIDIENGFELMDTSKFVDEASDILTVSIPNENGNNTTKIYVSQTFRPRIYELDWKTISGKLLWKGADPAAVVDGLHYINNALFFTTYGGFTKLDLKTLTSQEYSKKNIVGTHEKILDKANCAVLFSGKDEYFLSELWLTNPQKITSKYIDIIKNRTGLYIPVNQIISDNGLNRFMSIMNKNKLNSAVIDMKDDQGLLRYTSKDPLVTQMGSKSSYSVDLEKVVKKMKDDNKYLIARIVVFKDKSLYQYAEGKYAVQDRASKKPWQGINRYVDEEIEEVVNDEVVKTKTGKSVPLMYEEYWVDPYSEKVWEYNIAIAKELIARGFDEIQFDYIRFPTDGLNLHQASYPYREHNMDMESALISFLSYARKNIQAPIGIDIYGANGFYRSGTRTGQDVEMLAQFVDVILPMFYPSHFEQDFFAQTPAEERPYRIYYYGSFRNAVIARNKVVVRPWTQAFYLNVSYDRAHYNEDYVEKQVYGIRDSINNGYLHWNNSGRYDDIRPHPNFNTPYQWNSFEAKNNFRKPIFGSETE